MLAAAARGLGLVGAAVLLGVLLLRATDDVSGGNGGGAPDVGVFATDETTTTTEGIDTALRPPTQVRVIVFNAARMEGVAAEVTEGLKALGYPTLPPDNAPAEDATVIYFKPGFEREARALAPLASDVALIQALPDPSPFTGDAEADVVVLIGSNFGTPADTPTTPTTA